MDDRRVSFLAGDSPDDVLMYLSETAVSNVETLAKRGERVPGGVVLVVDGERGRAAFERAVGVDPMAFAGTAMRTEGRIDPDCTGGVCPDAETGGPVMGNDTDHSIRFLFAFAEERNEEAGGLYAEGDVVHAYAQCSCGAAYSEKWVAGERSAD